MKIELQNKHIFDNTQPSNADTAPVVSAEIHKRCGALSRNDLAHLMHL